MELKLKQHCTLCFFLAGKNKNICVHQKVPSVRFIILTLLLLVDVKFPGCPSLHLLLAVGSPVVVGLDFCWPKQKTVTTVVCGNLMACRTTKGGTGNSAVEMGGMEGTQDPSMGMVRMYLPVWMMNFYGKCRYSTIHGWDGVYNFLSS